MAPVGRARRRRVAVMGPLVGAVAGAVAGAVVVAVVLAAVPGAAGAAEDPWGGPPEDRARVDAIVADLPLLARVVMGTARLTWGCHPELGRCSWGAYDRDGRGGRGPFTVWIGPEAFASDARLRYVVYHELAHHVVDGLLAPPVADALVAPFGDRERHADCVAAALGGPGEERRTPYWPDGCPPELVDRATADLAALGVTASTRAGGTPLALTGPPPTPARRRPAPVERGPVVTEPAPSADQPPTAMGTAPRPAPTVGPGVVERAAGPSAGGGRRAPVVPLLLGVAAVAVVAAAMAAGSSERARRPSRRR